MIVRNEDADGKIGQAVKRLRQKVGVGRTMVAVGNGTGEWLRERNSLVGNLDLNKEGIWICEDKTCKQVSLDDL
jgi:hypothetical protein